MEEVEAVPIETPELITPPPLETVRLLLTEPEDAPKFRVPVLLHKELVPVTNTLLLVEFKSPIILMRAPLTCAPLEITRLLLLAVVSPITRLLVTTTTVFVSVTM